MNRQTKRMLARQERAAAKPKMAGGKRPPIPTQERRKRVSTRQFLREVRQELRKVQWPTRRELVAYTAVVVVTVAVMTAFVFGLDFLLSKLLLDFFA